MTIAALASLFLGIAIGFIGQRSRMCFVGGIRDFILVRDTFLLKGLISFGLTALVAFPLARQFTDTPLPSTFDGLTLLFTLIGAFAVGYISVLANGCPFRQHVLATQGVASSWTYLAGFYIGAVIFHTVIYPILLP